MGEDWMVYFLQSHAFTNLATINASTTRHTNANLDSTPRVSIGVPVIVFGGWLGVLHDNAIWNSPPAMAWAMHIVEEPDNKKRILGARPALLGVRLFACGIILDQILLDLQSFTHGSIWR
ncbi:Tryptophan/tyrosine permease [Artemisia annua]|uniref:Tryptophan/tyrosine permease n=1 Tax=Artemisia annua TaxID=35608 RepID=A0A2U1LAQ4_ARTAN|nr:Tryptophan/tyrosine permease [Artemisia annua]